MNREINPLHSPLLSSSSNPTSASPLLCVGAAGWISTWQLQAFSGSPHRSASTTHHNTHPVHSFEQRRTAHHWLSVHWVFGRCAASCFTHWLAAVLHALNPLPPTAAAAIDTSQGASRGYMYKPPRYKSRATSNLASRRNINWISRLRRSDRTFLHCSCPTD